MIHHCESCDWLATFDCINRIKYQIFKSRDLSRDFRHDKNFKIILYLCLIDDEFIFKICICKILFLCKIILTICYDYFVSNIILI